MAGYTGGTWLRHIWGENAKTGQIAFLLFIGAALVFLLFKRLASRQNAGSCD